MRRVLTATALLATIPAGIAGGVGGRKRRQRRRRGRRRCRWDHRDRRESGVAWHPTRWRIDGSCLMRAGLHRRDGDAKPR